MSLFNGIQGFLTSIFGTSSSNTSQVKTTQQAATAAAKQTASSDQYVSANTDEYAAAEKWATSTGGGATSFFGNIMTGLKNFGGKVKNFFGNVFTKIKNGFNSLFGIGPSTTQQTTTKPLTQSEQKINMLTQKGNEEIAALNIPEEMQQEVYGLFNELTNVESMADAKEIKEKLYAAVTEGVNAGIYSQDNLGENFEKAQMTCLHIATVKNIDKLNTQKDTLIASVNYPEEVKEELVALYDELSDVTSSDLAAEKIAQIDKVMQALEENNLCTDAMKNANKELQNICLNLAFATNIELDYQKIESAESASTRSTYQKRIADASSRFEFESLNLEANSVIEKAMGINDTHKAALTDIVAELWNNPVSASLANVQKNVQEYCTNNNLLNNMSIKTLFVTLGLQAPEDVKDLPCGCPPSCGCHNKSENDTTIKQPEATDKADDIAPEEPSVKETEKKTETATTKDLDLSEKMLETAVGLFVMATDGEEENMAMFNGDSQKFWEYVNQKGEEALEDYFES